MVSSILLFLLIGLSYISGNPEPLVSSSGLVPALPPIEEDETRGPEDSLRIVKKEAPYGRLSDRSNLDRSSDAATWKVNGGRTATTLDMEADPMEWGRMSPAAGNRPDTQKNSAVWGQHNTGPGSTKSPKVVYSKGRKSLLHPYVSDPSSVVTIPTMIITPSTTENSLLNSRSTVAVPLDVHGKSIVLHPGAHGNHDSQKSLIDGGEAFANDSSKLIISSPKFILVDKDAYDDLEASSRKVRTSDPDTTVTEQQESEATTNSNVEIDGDTYPLNGGNDHEKMSTLKVPWEDDEIVGKLHVDPMIENVEVSFKVASKLCKKMAEEVPLRNDKYKRYYLWAPINQYLPLLRKAFPIRPPLFAPECLKWVLRQCRGTIRLPMLKPCTYWAPLIIRRPECGFNPNIQSKIVNFRLPEFVPGNCPCVWPCTKRFDPIQRCHITVSESERHFDHLHSDGEPWHEKEIIIQDNLAEQLCRGMKLAMTVDNTVPIGWLPIRVDVYPTAETNESTFHASFVRKKRWSVSHTNPRIKREQIYVNPGLDTEGSDEDDDRFTFMDTFNSENPEGGTNSENMTTIRKCNVWKYKACPKDKVSLEAEVIDFASKTGRRRKRSLSQYLSRLALGLNNEKERELVQNRTRFVRQMELDEDDIIFENTADCGEWIKTESYQCISEDHVLDVLKNHTITSTEDDDDNNQLTLGNEKKKVIKDLCPGSTGRFPCFLRRKRSVNDYELELEKKELDAIEDSMQNRKDKRDSENGNTGESTTQSSTYLINKIQIQPDPGCMCDWPCLPFFDRVNQCYNSKGDLLLDKWGRPKISSRSFRKSQRDPVVCINFVETDEIYCKIK